MPLAEFRAWCQATSVARDFVEAVAGVPRERQDSSIGETLRAIGLTTPVAAELERQIRDAFEAWQGDGALHHHRHARSIRSSVQWRFDPDDDEDEYERYIAQIETHHSDLARRVDITVTRDGEPWIVEHPDPEIARQLTMLSTQMRDATFGALMSTPKIPYTDQGIAVLRRAVEDALAPVGVTLAAFDVRQDAAGRRIAIDFSVRAPADIAGDEIVLSGDVSV